MNKPRVASPRLRLWIAGLLILAGTFVLVETAWYPVAFYLDPRENTTWHTIANRSYSGVLSATNQSAVIPLDEVTSWTELRLSSLWTNQTPITVILRDGNDSVVLQLVNYTSDATTTPDWLEVKVRGELGPEWFPGPPTLTVWRVSADVRFFLRIVIGYWIPALPSVPSFGAVILGNVLGVALIGSGFGLIEGVVAGIRRERL